MQRQLSNRMEKLESMVGTSTRRVDISHLSDEEKVQAYQDAVTGRPLFILKNGSHIPLCDLTVDELAKMYREFINGRIQLFSEDEIQREKS